MSGFQNRWEFPGCNCPQKANPRKINIFFSSPLFTVACAFDFVREATHFVEIGARGSSQLGAGVRILTSLYVSFKFVWRVGVETRAEQRWF